MSAVGDSQPLTPDCRLTTADCRLPSCRQCQRKLIRNPPRGEALVRFREWQSMPCISVKLLRLCLTLGPADSNFPTSKPRDLENILTIYRPSLRFVLPICANNRVIKTHSASLPSRFKPKVTNNCQTEMGDGIQYWDWDCDWDPLKNCF